MPSFLHPGVFTIEVPSPAKSIEAAGTSTPIFFGETERGPLTPTRMTSRADFDRTFGGYLRAKTQGVAVAGEPAQASLPYAMDGFFGNGGGSCYVIRTLDGTSYTNFNVDTGSRTLASTAPTIKVVASSPGIWSYAFNGSTDNWYGGVIAYFTPSSDQPTSASTITRFRILVATKSLVTGTWAIVEDWDRLSADPNDENYVIDTLNRSLFIRWDPLTPANVPNVAQLDNQFNPIVPSGSTPSRLLPGSTSTGVTSQVIMTQVGHGLHISSGSTTFTNGDAPASQYTSHFFALADDITDAAILCVPRMNADGGSTGGIGDNMAAFYNAAAAYCEARPARDLFAIATMGRHSNNALTSGAVQALVAEYTTNITVKSTLAATWWPWLKVADPIGVGKNPRTMVDPSGYMAGVFARTDGQRGVWKAPAGINAGVLGVTSLDFKVKDVDQDSLNPIGINAIRLQPAGGIVSWGSRTNQPGSEWRYVPVRRTAMMLRKSISDGIQFAVFEPNDEPLWSALRLTVGSFMDRMFKQGAFAGSSAKDAYFVKCDASTTSAADQGAGVVNLLVGFAPLRPAEFVIVKLSQIVAQTA